MDLGFKTKIVAINGENGEFHSFCYEGPIFKEKIKVGEIIEKTYDLDKEKGLKSTYFFAELDFLGFNY